MTFPFSADNNFCIRTVPSLREKAKTAGSSVIYLHDKKIIEENPLTLTKTVVAAKADY